MYNMVEDLRFFDAFILIQVREGYNNYFIIGFRFFIVIRWVIIRIFV